MDGHQSSQAIPAFGTKSCELVTQSHMFNFCEGLRGLCRDMPWLWSIETNNAKHKNFFCFLKKKSKTKKNKKYYNDFRKVVISNWIPDALHDLHVSKYKSPRNKPTDGCLWKLAKRNSIRESKQLRFVAITEAGFRRMLCESMCIQIFALSK